MPFIFGDSSNLTLDGIHVNSCNSQNCKESGEFIVSIPTGNVLQSSMLMKPKSNHRWWAVILAAGCLAINYLDRVAMAVAAPTLMNEFNFTTMELGILMSAFTWGYMIALTPAGWLSNRYGSRLVMFWSCLGWGLVTAVTPIIQGFRSFLILRIILGIVESPVMPGGTRAISVWVPQRERVLASGIFSCATKLGNAVTPPVVAFMIISWGWRVAFIICGGVAVLYALFLLKAYKEPDEHPKITPEELAWIRQDEVVDETGKVVTKQIPIWKLFAYPSFILTSIGMGFWFCYYVNFYMWIPTYLVKAKGLDLKAMGFAAMIPFLFAVPSELFGGWFADKWFARGASVNTVRRTIMGVGLIVSATALYLATAAPTPVMTVFWLTVSMAFAAFQNPNNVACCNDIAPYGQGGGVIGVNLTVGSIGAALGSIGVGYVASTSLGYDGGLWLLVAAALLAALSYGVVDYRRIIPK
jgi:ACS family glucarate transporter-like MFS transporter